MKTTVFMKILSERGGGMPDAGGPLGGYGGRIEFFLYGRENPDIQSILVAWGLER